MIQISELQRTINKNRKTTVRNEVFAQWLNHVNSKQANVNDRNIARRYKRLGFDMQGELRKAILNRLMRKASHHDLQFGMIYSIVLEMLTDAERGMIVDADNDQQQFIK